MAFQIIIIISSIFSQASVDKSTSILQFGENNTLFQQV